MHFSFFKFSAFYANLEGSSPDELRDSGEMCTLIHPGSIAFVTWANRTEQKSKEREKDREQRRLVCFTSAKWIIS